MNLKTENGKLSVLVLTAALLQECRTITNDILNSEIASPSLVSNIDVLATIHTRCNVAAFNDVHSSGLVVVYLPPDYDLRQVISDFNLIVLVEGATPEYQKRVGHENEPVYNRCVDVINEADLPIPIVQATRNDQGVYEIEVI